MIWIDSFEVLIASDWEDSEKHMFEADKQLDHAL